jgi:hypothetical protein
MAVSFVILTVIFIASFAGLYLYGICDYAWGLWILIADAVAATIFFSYYFYHWLIKPLIKDKEGEKRNG